MELTADGRVITTSREFRKNFSSYNIWAEGFINYSIIVQTLWGTPTSLAVAMARFLQSIMLLSKDYVWNSVLNLALVIHQRAMKLGQIEPLNWVIPMELQVANCTFSTLKPVIASPKRPRADTTESPQGQTCGNFNRGKPCNKSPCSYLHACYKCRGNHAKKDCKS